MSEETQVIHPPKEDDVLAYTHNVRLDVIKNLTKRGMPEDKGELKLLLNTLDGMDHSALSRKRIKLEEQTNKNQEHAASLISRVLEASLQHRLHNPVHEIRQIPTLDQNIPEPTIVEGELSVGSFNITFNEFMTK